MSYVEANSGNDPTKSSHFVINWSGVVGALSDKKSTIQCQNRYQTLRKAASLKLAESSGMSIDSVSSTPVRPIPLVKPATNTTTDLLTSVSSAVQAVTGALTKVRGKRT